MSKKNIILVFGGRSSEHEVSINSAKNIFAAMDIQLWNPLLIGISKQGTWYQFSKDEFSKLSSIEDQNSLEKNRVVLFNHSLKTYLMSFHDNQKTVIDCAFPIVHGTNGEDGTLQGFFKTLQLPFVGCGVLGSALCMDKEYMKLVMTQSGISNSKFKVIHRSNILKHSDLIKELGSPFFIKPANAGSSVGVHKIKNESDYLNFIEDSLLYDHKVIAEEFIDGREIECSVKGSQNHAEAATPGELVVKHEFYSYEAKYLDDNGAEIIIPANLSTEQTESIRNLAVKTYQALCCDGMARVDFFMKKDGSLIVNEVNTLPGFTKISMYPMMWKARGLDYSELITDLIQQAFKKFEVDSKIKLTF